MEGTNAGELALLDLTPSARQERIAEYVLQQGSVTVDSLAEMFGVSRMTIHRDLDDLEAQGVLRKVRGGATAERSDLFESDVRFRMRSAVKEKEALARAAVNYVEPGQAIMLDESTTLIPLARLLRNITPLTVITNFFPIIHELVDAPGIRLIVLGGEYAPKYDSLTGILCEQSIASLRANTVFMSTPVVSEGIAFHQEERVVKVKRAMLASAKQRILLLDNSKFGKVALHKLCPLTDFHRVLVDSGTSEENLRELREARVPVEIAPLENPGGD